MSLKPGDKVLIIMDCFDAFADCYIHEDDAYYLVATKESLGVVATYEEYSDFIFRINGDLSPSDKDYFQGFIMRRKQETENGEGYLFFVK